MVEIPKESYKGKIRVELIGTGDGAIGVGGEETLPFHSFEGKIPNPPRIALEVYDTQPNWPPALVEVWEDVLGNPLAWAKKCVERYSAELLCIQLESTDPTGLNRDAEEAARLVKEITEVVSVPLIVLGTGNAEKDSEVLKKVAEACEGKNLLLGPAKEENYKTIGAAALGYGHSVIASTPMDVNLEKQLNILLENLGVPLERVVIDPTTGALGYGIEYSYSVIERNRIAALFQNDDKMQNPILCNLGKEAWKAREAKVSEELEPRFGDANTRGILWEAMTAHTLLLAGADILIMRHPEAVSLVREVMREIL